MARESQIEVILRKLNNIMTGGAPPSGPAGGDLGGTYPNPTVTGINTVPVAGATTATGGGAVNAGKVLILDGGGLANGVNLNNIATGGTANSLLHGGGANYSLLTKADAVGSPSAPVIQGGAAVALVAGQSAFIPANVTATSSIAPSINVATPGAGSLTNEYAALAADRVVGTIGGGGGFKITALLVAGTINVLDTSRMDWIIYG